MAPARISAEFVSSDRPTEASIKREPAKDKHALEQQIRSDDLVPLWNAGGPPSAPQPHTKHIPAVWRYEDTKRHLLRAVELVPQHEAERRAVLMINPGPRQPPFTTDVLLAAHQLITPGEKALCHRHSPFAVRFLIEGEHGYTAIDGKKMYMAPGDLIITPRWKWHDHGNEGTKNVIWLDGLDIPLFKSIPIDFTEHYVDDHGTEYHPSTACADDAARAMKFPWATMESSLDAEPGDFASIEYLHQDGSSVSTTIGASAERINAGAQSTRRQETASHIFQVHRGAGWVEVNSADGKVNSKLAFGPHDSFVVPCWHCFVIHADEKEPVYLFCFTDKPMQKLLGLWRSKA